MRITTVSEPAAEPLLEAAFLEHSKIYAVDNADQTSLFASYIKAARQRVETYLRKRLITQTVKLTMDGFGSDAIELPIGPIQEITTVKYVDGTGTLQTMSSADYRLIESQEPALLMPAYGQTWPTPRSGDLGTVEVTLVVGYGDAGSDVPDDILQAIRLLAAHEHENREATIMGAAVSIIDLGVDYYLAPHRLWV